MIQAISEILIPAGLPAQAKILITGGLGALGSLVAQWISQTAQEAQLWLIGRSASATLSSQLLHAASQIHVVQCDTGSSEECRALLSAQAFELIIHAGESTLNICFPFSSWSNLWQSIAGYYSLGAAIIWREAEMRLVGLTPKHS